MLPAGHGRDRSTRARTAFSEILYASISQTGNNGSALAGITVNGRFCHHRRHRHAVGPLLLHHPRAWRWPARWPPRSVPASSGTFPTTGGIFVGLLVGVILIVGALTYLPALALGPIVEQLLMHAGKVF